MIDRKCRFLGPVNNEKKRKTTHLFYKSFHALSSTVCNQSLPKTSVLAWWVSGFSKGSCPTGWSRVNAITCTCFPTKFSGTSIEMLLLSGIITVRIISSLKLIWSLYHILQSRQENHFHQYLSQTSPVQFCHQFACVISRVKASFQNNPLPAD